MILPSIRMSMLSYSQITTFVRWEQGQFRLHSILGAAYLLKILEDDILGNFSQPADETRTHRETHDGLNHHTLLASRHPG